MSTPEFEEEIVRAMEENPALTTLEATGEVPGTEELKTGEIDDESYDDEPVYCSVKKSHDNYIKTFVSGEDIDPLDRQLSELQLTEREREIASYIIGNLNSSGYLTRSAREIADDMAMTAGIEVPLAEVERMIDMVKGLEPAGIGATDLQECLLLQLNRMKQSPTAAVAREIIEKNYKAFINNRHELLSEALGCDSKLLKDALKLIRTLNPKPGLGLLEGDGDERARHISPDFIIEIDDDGRMSVSLAGLIPELVVEPSFRLEDRDVISPKAEEFIKERRDGAEDFIRAVRGRGVVLMTIIKAIIRLQPEYFNSFELKDIRPMVIKDLEDLTGYDKSVISRATSSKYILTPEGIVPLKLLFGESVSSNNEVAPREIEAALKKLVENEDKRRPLSDDELTAALAEQNIAVARRTVAKYRERMGIPVARLRKQVLNDESR